MEDRYMYKDMSKILKDRQIGDFKLSHFTISNHDGYAMCHGITPEDYVRLEHRGSVLMSNTPMEKRTNEDFVTNAHGKVLIGGLGIGLILLAIQDDPMIDKITVVEKNQEVIDLVASQLPLNDKVEIICADVYDYIPEEFYNTIYMDIWSFINEDVCYDEMYPLMDKYEQYLDVNDEDGYIDCWCRYEAEHGIRI